MNSDPLKMCINYGLTPPTNLKEADSNYSDPKYALFPELVDKFKDENNRCVIGATSGTGRECPAGHFCPAGSVVPEACPIGTFRADTKGTTKSDCEDCTAGKECIHRGLTAPGDPCEGGYYCPAGSDEKYAEGCPAGHYCPAGSAAATVCPIGTYQPNELQTSCKDCPKGYYCHQTAMFLPQICPKGFFCPAKTGVYNANDTLKCPLGTFSDIEGLEDSSGC